MNSAQIVEHRFDRQIELFGAEGQSAIAESHVCVVGLGGVGSHIAQQLAYLGVGRLTLVDGDRVEATNLNRLIGAVEEDIVQKSLKVDVAKRLVRSIQPSTEVVTLPRSIGASDDDVVAGSDFVFGCLDNDLARLTMTNLTAKLAVPYLDIASDTGGGSSVWYGGRILLADGRRCLVCTGLLDQREIALAAMSEDERLLNDRIYGVPVDHLHRTGPAVVSINGAIASLSVTTFMAWMTNLGTAYPHVVYRGDLGIVTLNNDPPRIASCYYCQQYSRAMA